jgi:S-adenosylmethionine hydrolase
MKPSRLVTLLTDFGQQDWFVGVMKGVILALQPALRLKVGSQVELRRP